MTIIRCILLLPILIFSTFCFGQNTVQDIWSSGTDAKFNHIEKLPSGEFLVVGTAFSNETNSNDFLVFKLSSNQDTLWSRTYGTSSNEGGSSAAQSQDGNYFIVGGSGNQLALLKINTFGDLIWQRSFGSDEGDTGHDVVEDEDGNIYVTGSTADGPGISQSYTFKLDPEGNYLWSRTYGANGADGSFGMELSNDGGVVCVGQAWGSSFNLGIGNGYVVKLSSTAYIDWFLALGSNADDNLFNVIQTSDGSYVAVGYYGASGARDALMTKLNQNGTVHWSRTYGGEMKDTFIDVTETSDGGLIAVGATESFGGGMNDIYAVRTDATGDTLWTKTYGGAMNDGGSGGLADQSMSVVENANGGFTIVSFSESFSGGTGSGFIIRTDANGNSSNCNQYETQTNVLSPEVLTNLGGAFSTHQEIHDLALGEYQPTYQVNHLIPAVELSEVAPICGSDTVLLTASGALEYDWLNGTHFGDEWQTEVDNSQLIFVEGTDENGCSGFAFEEVLVFPVPEVSINGVAPLCVGDSVNLSASGALEYQWEEFNLEGQEITVSPIESLIVSVTGTDENNCSNSAEIELLVNDLPAIEVNGETVVCAGDTVVLMASGGVNYQWEGLAAEGSTVSLIPENDVEVSAVGTDENGCSSASTIEIEVFEIPDATITENAGLLILDNPGLGLDYQWLDCDEEYALIPDATSSTYAPLESGNYAISVSNEGCNSWSDCVSVTVVGIDGLPSDHEIVVYPNPSEGHFSVDLGGLFSGMTATLTTTDGRILQKMELGQSEVFTLSLEQPAGVYYLSLSSSEVNGVYRLIKR